MRTSELYEHWMEVETSYALGKFSPADQYPYWVQGVARGHFSFMVSAMNYLNRAKVFAEQVENQNDPLGLQVAQCLGKAAHNLVALDATAKSYMTDRHSHISSQVDTFSYLASNLEILEPTDYIKPAMIKESQVFRGVVFQRLQGLQDGNDPEAFHRCLRPELIFAARQFVAASEAYGWTTPGVSSGNITLWPIAES